MEIHICNSSLYFYSFQFRNGIVQIDHSKENLRNGYVSQIHLTKNNQRMSVPNVLTFNILLQAFHMIAASMRIVYRL